jgi:zinc protease
MEADRMGWLLPALSQARLETQRGVVLNERRQSYENRPYGLGGVCRDGRPLSAAHPYHWPTIGEPADLEAATFDDVRAFFRRYYHPGNASLVIAGDVATDVALAEAEDLFGQIPAGEPVPPVRVDAVHDGTRRLVMEDRVELPRLYLAWRSPALFAPGDAELDLVGDSGCQRPDVASVQETDPRPAHRRGTGRRSDIARTWRHVSNHRVGRAWPHARRTRTGHSRRDRALCRSRPSDQEVDRGRVQAEAAFVFRVQSLGGFGGKADQLKRVQHLPGRADSFDVDLARYLGATGRALGDAAGEWLQPRHAVTLGIVPMGQSAGALSRAESLERPA